RFMRGTQIQGRASGIPDEGAGVPEVLHRSDVAVGAVRGTPADAEAVHEHRAGSLSAVLRPGMHAQSQGAPGDSDSDHAGGDALSAASGSAYAGVRRSSCSIAAWVNVCPGRRDLLPSTAGWARRRTLHAKADAAPLGRV